MKLLIRIMIAATVIILVSREFRVAEAPAFMRGEEATLNFLRVNPEK